MTTEIPAEIQQQYQALGQGCGYHRFAQRTLLELTGVDRVKFLHNFCTADVKRLEPGRGAEAFITNVQGKTIGYVSVLIRPESILLEGAASQADALIPHLSKYVILEDAEIHDRGDQLAAMLIAGSNSNAVLADTITGELPHPHDNVARSLDSAEVVVARGLHTGSDCYLLIGTPEALANWESACRRAGAVDCSHEAVEMRRLEAGIPQFGSEVTEANLPQEIGRDQQAISFTKGCYLGQETVARIDALGHVNRYLRVVKFTGDVLPDPGWEHAVDGKTVFKVTSAAYSPMLEAPIALAFARRGQEAVGTQFETELGIAEVIEPPGA